MPKPKRYENVQNSVHSASTSRGAAQSSSTTESEPSHFHDTPLPHQLLNQNLRQQRLTSFLQPIPRRTPSVQDSAQPTPSVQTTTQPIPSGQTTTQPIPSIQTASQSKPPKKSSGRESMSHWTVDAIDSQGAIKKLKLKKTDVFNLSNGERIVVDFDDLDSPIGEGQGILAGFCGILARDSSIFPVHFEKWSDLPAAYFNNCFDQFIKPRFCFRTSESNARRYAYSSMCKKWGARRLKLFNAIDDPLKSRDQIRAEAINKVPDGIPRDQWISYVDYRLKEKTREMCKINAEIRKTQTISHIGGSKPNSKRRAEMEKIEQAMTQSTADESEISPNHAVGKVLGKEHSGRVRCLGLGAVPSRAFKQTRPRYSDLNASSYNNGSCSSQWQEKYNQMLSAHNKSQDDLNFR
ncbi:uncharacterized protein LOC132029998 isoform X2 [Lycium ferocissimum]|uniref:uncharacterized protein LOC132029998 isoform X2 n=1 Tax=Lycium ferocissimum TaxID=112874 RepID=UPI002814FF47|nr:uncharacterized protein LOC132029998 isoform X2 [Lycium ferocissimum]